MACRGVPADLVDAEITSRDESDARARMKAAALPGIETIDEFGVAASSNPQPTFRHETPQRRGEIRQTPANVGREDSRAKTACWLNNVPRDPRKSPGAGRSCGHRL